MTIGYKSYLALDVTTLEILTVPSEDLMNRTGDLDLSSFVDEVAKLRASGGTSPLGYSSASSSPKTTSSNDH